MTELSKEKMSELVTLLSVNRIKYQSGFEQVLNDDYSDDPSKYDLVCKAIERIVELAHDCVDHGVSRERKKDIFALSKICVKLTKTRGSKKTMALRQNVDAIATKVYNEKNTVNVKGELLSLIGETISGLTSMQEKEEKNGQGTVSYKEVSTSLTELAERIRACYDNSSLEAATRMKNIYADVSTVRSKLGMGTLGETKFREYRDHMNEEVEAWSKLVRAGGKKAKPEDLVPSVAKGGDVQFDVKAKSRKYLEDLEILKGKVENYKNETEIACDVSEYVKEQDELIAQIGKQKAELAELKAQVVAKRMTEEAALAKGKPIKASMTVNDRTLKGISRNIEMNQMLRGPRTTIYIEVREISKIIESNRTNPIRLYAFTKLLDLDQITNFLSGIADTEEERQKQFNTLRYIRKLAERIQLETFGQANTINAETDKYVERIQREMESRWEEFEKRTVGTKQTVPTDKQFEDVFGDISLDESELDTVDAGATESNDQFDYEEALKLK